MCKGARRWVFSVRHISGYRLCSIFLMLSKPSVVFPDDDDGGNYRGHYLQRVFNATGFCGHGFTARSPVKRASLPMVPCSRSFRSTSRTHLLEHVSYQAHHSQIHQRVGHIRKPPIVLQLEADIWGLVISSARGDGQSTDIRAALGRMVQSWTDLRLHESVASPDRLFFQDHLVQGNTAGQKCKRREAPGAY